MRHAPKSIAPQAAATFTDDEARDRVYDLAMTARANRRQIAALATALRVAVMRIADRGGPTSPFVAEALDLVEAWSRGERVARKVLDHAATGAFEAGSKYGVGSPPYENAARWVFDAVAKLAWMAATGADNGELVLTHAGYGWLDPGATALSRDRELREVYTRALASHATIPDAPIARPKRRVNLRDAAALSASREALGAAGSLLDRLGAERDAKQTATREKLVALLGRSGYAVHVAVVEFEARFGGLRLPSERNEDWREQGLYAIVGTYACVRSSAHGLPRGGESQASLQLVPILYVPSDTVVFVDHDGKAYAQDTVGDIEALPFATNARDALVKVVESLAVHAGAKFL